MVPPCLLRSLLVFLFISRVDVICLSVNSSNLFTYYRKLDHFNRDDDVYIKVAAEIFSENYETSPTSPILVYLTTTPKKTPASLVSLANSVKGVLLVMPTRFFSLTNLNKEQQRIFSLKYLAINQIIEDVREFIEQFIQSEKKLIVSSSNPVILIGKDFLGSICYYSKLKYPNLYNVAIAQDPILYASLGFPEYDRQVYNLYFEIDHDCPQQIQKMVNDLERIMDEKTLFKSPSEHNLQEDLIKATTKQILIEQLSLLFQSLIESREAAQTFCSYLQSTSDINDKFQALIQLEQQKLVIKPETPMSQEQRELRMWLDCTFFGLFPIADSTNNIKSSTYFDISYYMKQCVDTFPTYSDNLTFNFSEAAQLNEVVTFLSKTLLVSTNSVARKALSKFDPENIFVISCDQCDYTSSFAEPQESVQDVIEQVRQYIVAWIQFT